MRPERAAIYRAAPMKMSRPQTASNPLAILLTANYRRTTLAIWLAAFLSLFCIYGMTGWLPTVMMQRGETFSASFGFGAVLQIMSFIGGLTVGNLIDRFGRSRGLMAIWWTIGGAAVLSLTVFNTHLFNLTAVALAGFCFSAQFVLNNFTAASYETGVRATAVGMELAVARFGVILGPLVAGMLQQIYRSPTPMFVSIGLSAIASGAIILFAKRPTTERADSAQSSIAAAEAVDAAERGPA